MLSQGRVSTAMSGTCHPRELPAGRYPEGEDTCRKSQSVISQPSPSQPSDCGRTIDDDLRTTAHPPCRLSSCPVLPSRSVGDQSQQRGRPSAQYCVIGIARTTLPRPGGNVGTWERGNIGGQTQRLAQGQLNPYLFLISPSPAMRAGPAPRAVMHKACLQCQYQRGDPFVCFKLKSRRRNLDYSRRLCAKEAPPRPR